jgi:hypothetical protein
VINFLISRDTSKVFFGPSLPLPELVNTLAEPFPEGFKVNTDDQGVALLRGTASGGECTISVFRLSTLTKAACAPGTFSGSNVSCVEEGSALFNQCSNAIVVTPSGVAEHQGTILSVTYMPDKQISLYMALEGQVQVTPLRKMNDYTQPSEPVSLDAGQYFYTAPDDHMTTIGGFPMRVALPLDNVAPLVSELGLLKWFQQTQGMLEKQGYPIQVVPVEMIPPILTVRMAGKPLDTAKGREAVLSGAPWTDAAVRAIGIPSLKLFANTVDLTDQQDIRDFKYDPALTREILSGQGFANGLPVVIFYPREDGMLAKLAEELTASLSKSGIYAEAGAVPGQEIERVVQAYQDEGKPVIWLQLDFPVTGY